jgi:urease accessory protein
MNKKWPLPASLLLLALPGIAAAHPGHDAGSSFAAGMIHPLAGFDHLCALLAVGLLAGRMGARAGAAVASTFLALSGVGMLGGFAGIELPAGELGIGASVAIIALLAWRPPRALPVATAALAGLFALFHGHAHGAEAVEGTAQLAYSAGMLLASGAVIAAGAWLAIAPAWSRFPLQHRRH